jgi:hypothetical protein
MVFKFYINDIEIDEPVGFDATKIMLKRSDNWHGVLSEASEENVEIYGQGFEILSALYNEFGIDAVAKMRIEYYCSGVLEDNVEYNITFYDYKEYCGNDCYCEVGIERVGCFYQFRNAMETKVNLDALTSIDKTTLLSDYEYLGKEIEIPGKTIRLTNHAVHNEDLVYSNPIIMTLDNIYKYWFIPFPTVINQEIEIFQPISADGDNLEGLYQSSSTNLPPDTACFKLETLDPNITGTYKLTGKVKGAVAVVPDSENSFDAITFIIEKHDYDGNVIGSPLVSENIPFSNVVTDIFYGYETEMSVGFFDIDIDLDISYTEHNLHIYIFTNLESYTVSFSSDPPVFQFSKDNYIDMKINSLYPPTPAKLYLPNEALSHISEYNTNNCMGVYSEYLGRTDSQPYSQIIDGCGGMLGITNGLFLRQLEYTRTGDKTPILSLSFNEILEALNCINPIGFSIEKRGEDEVVRVENWEYFYNDSIVVDLGTVSVKKEPDVKLHFKNFKTGYAKYEAEEYNGLDEFLTEREYTTNLVNHNLDLNKTCQFIASGYAIELTRRQGNTTSSDWRFDNDTFVIALKREDTALSVEQGNITSPLNIIDPPTILNFRISPARMAMNWFQYLTTFLKTTKELIFSSGKGNIAAQGESYSNCTIESGVISEKQNLLQADFQGNQDGIFTAELHTISEAPMTFKQYKLIQSNPHGLIAYKCSDVQLYGWIKQLKYSFIDGSASFILIPKVNI